MNVTQKAHKIFKTSKASTWAKAMELAHKTVNPVFSGVASDYSFHSEKIWGATNADLKRFAIKLHPQAVKLKVADNWRNISARSYDVIDANNHVIGTIFVN